MENQFKVVCKWFPEGMPIYGVSRCKLRKYFWCWKFWCNLRRKHLCKHKYYTRSKFGGNIVDECLWWGDKVVPILPPKFEKNYWGVTEFTFNDED